MANRWRNSEIILKEVVEIKHFTVVMNTSADGRFLLVRYISSYQMVSISKLKEYELERIDCEYSCMNMD